MAAGIVYTSGSPPNLTPPAGSAKKFFDHSSSTSHQTSADLIPDGSKSLSHLDDATTNKVQVVYRRQPSPCAESFEINLHNERQMRSAASQSMNSLHSGSPGALNLGIAEEKHRDDGNDSANVDEPELAQLHKSVSNNHSSNHHQQHNSSSSNPNTSPNDSKSLGVKHKLNSEGSLELLTLHLSNDGARSTPVNASGKGDFPLLDKKSSGNAMVGVGLSIEENSESGRQDTERRPSTEMLASELDDKLSIEYA